MGLTIRKTRRSPPELAAIDFRVAFPPHSPVPATRVDFDAAAGQKNERDGDEDGLGFCGVEAFLLCGAV